VKDITDGQIQIAFGTWKYVISHNFRTDYLRNTMNMCKLHD